MKKGDKVTVKPEVSKGLYPGIYEILRTAKDGSWADVITGRYTCWRFKQIDLILK